MHCGAVDELWNICADDWIPGDLVVIVAHPVGHLGTGIIPRTGED